MQRRNKFIGRPLTFRAPQGERYSW